MREKIKKHWKVLLVAVIAGVVAAVGAALVFIWFVERSDIGLQGTATFDQWSLAWVVKFIVMLVLWELLYVGLPAVLFFGLGGYLWWNGLPEKEKQEFKREGKKSKSHGTRNAGGSGFFFNIAYCIYIAIDGNYSTPFGDLPYSYWVYACLWTMLWLLIIVGIPILIGGIVYFIVWDRKPNLSDCDE